LDLAVFDERRHRQAGADDEVRRLAALHTLRDPADGAVFDDQLVAGRALELAGDFLEYRLHRGGGQQA
jgi:hypothetical protein